MNKVWKVGVGKELKSRAVFIEGWGVVGGGWNRGNLIDLN